MNRLNFGPLFSNLDKVTFLTNSEAAALLETLQDTDDEPSSVIQAAKSYANLASYDVKSSVVVNLREKIDTMQENVRSHLRRKLHPYELALLINLTPEDYEQAVSLIPSLLDFDGVDEKQLVEEAVSEINKTALERN